VPSTATITAMTIFSPLTVIKSSEMNANFGNFRGHLIAVEPSSAAAAVAQTYDVGSSDHRWRYLYGTLAPSVVSTTGSMTIAITQDVVLMNCTGQTNTATLPTAVGHVGLLTIKNIGTGGFTAYLDASGTEKIDNTLTVNLVDGESTTLVSDNANWWSI
jgi:hypothetical protein